MEKYKGDLTDIVRAGSSTSSAAEWHYFPANPIIHHPDPFTRFGDPLILRDDIDTPPVSAGFFHNSSTSSTTITKGVENIAHKIHDHHDDDEMKRASSSIFSKMLQICPNTTTTYSKLPPPCSINLLLPNSYGNIDDTNFIISPNSSKETQISSPRNTGIKRRKSGEAKKIVCIPAAANRPTTTSSGEVVPSDLWAWRKYGQKPIKGSPYPRGYYRCSSSKGCLARKQVERSRTDPNMLVITYTSEHNHPWPTQRNALAGSTRSTTHHHHPTKNTTSSNHDDHQSQKQTNTTKKDDQHTKEIKEEIMKQDFDTNNSNNGSNEFEEGLLQSYKPAFLDQSEDINFFAELGEINEADPLDLLFTTDKHDDDQKNKLDLDPFSFYI